MGAVALNATAPKFYISDSYSAVISSTLVSLGLPGRQASSNADCARNGISSFYTISFKPDGIPTSEASFLTASIAAFLYSS